MRRDLHFTWVETMDQVLKFVLHEAEVHPAVLVAAAGRISLDEAQDEHPTGNIPAEVHNPQPQPMGEPLNYEL